MKGESNIAPQIGGSNLFDSSTSSSCVTESYSCEEEYVCESYPCFDGRPFFCEDESAEYEYFCESADIDEDICYLNAEDGLTSPVPSLFVAKPESREQSIFVHSSPSQFPDIRKAKKSVFGSIFVRSSTPKKYVSPFRTRPTGRRHVIENLDTKSSSGNSYDTSAHGDSVFEAFEGCGILKKDSSASDFEWDICHITESAMFSFKREDRVHQTRNVSKIKERIMNGQKQYLKFSYGWPSGSSWSGHWDSLGMAGTGTFTMPHDVSYIGKLKDGQCHDTDALLLYPNGFRALHCHYENGKLLNYKFQFPDTLDHEKENWAYCQQPDRRFWSEVQNGLKPSKTAQKTQMDPPRKIPEGCYDTNDGFYNPKTKMLVNFEGELLRVPTCEEEKWIKAKCRKGFHEFTGFCPDLYENWYDNDKELIQRMVEMQKNYFSGKITYKELYQFYADNDILPTCSPFKKTKTLSQIELDKITESCPTPKKLGHRLEKRFEGHKMLPPNENLTAQRSILNQKRQLKRKSALDEERKLDINLERLSWKIKFDENNKTPTLSIDTASLEQKDSKTVLKHVGVSVSDSPKKEERYSVSSPRSPSPLYESQHAFESTSSTHEHRFLRKSMKEIIMKIVDDIVLQELEHHRDRIVRLLSVRNVPFGSRDDKEKSAQMLKELYGSAPGGEEFCDSLPHQACNLKKLAEDKYQSIRYWGKRIFTLNFGEDVVPSRAAAFSTSASMSKVGQHKVRD